MARMVRWTRIAGLVGVLFALVVAGAQARTPQAGYGRAVVDTCDQDGRQATFEGQMRVYRRATKMQLRFTLQASTPDAPRWRKVEAEGFGEWITAPPNLGKYIYDKTVQDLLAPASYRTVVDFRWRDRRGRTLRTERAISPVCRQADTRPDLVVRSVRLDGGQYVAVVFNRGREAAGAFAVGFALDGAAGQTVELAGLAPQTSVTVMAPAGSAPCAPGTPLDAVADPRAQVEEADEDNNTRSGAC